MKMQVGICDDCKQDMDLVAREVSDIFESLKYEYELHLFENGSELMHANDDALDMDILLLDIYMPGLDGIKVAEQITKQNQLVNVIFVSSHDDLVFQAIHCNPFRFIRKERLADELDEAITSAITKIKDETLIYGFGNSQENVKIPVKNVLYIESKGHYLHIHTIDGKVNIVRGKISEYDERMNSVGFVRIHVGYLVNIRYIHSISSKRVILDNYEELPISRKNVESIKEKCANYVRRFVRGLH